jgi:hypothetical protein
MLSRGCLPLAVTLLLLGHPLGALARSGEEAFQDRLPPSGALIFQRRDSLEGRALGLATDSPYTHVGIIRITGGGPYVMQSSAETDGVEEVPLEDFIDSGVDRKFSVYVTRRDYRPPGQLNSPASLAAYDYYHRPYDFFYGRDSDALYGAELIFKIFQDIDHPIGKETMIGDLNFDTEAGRAFFLDDWRGHPACEGAPSRQACWDRLQREWIITPRALSEDPELSLYITTF